LLHLLDNNNRLRSSGNIAGKHRENDNNIIYRRVDNDSQTMIDNDQDDGISIRSAILASLDAMKFSTLNLKK